MSSSTQLRPELRDTRYGYQDLKPPVPTDEVYQKWMHYRYANGTSLDTMRTELKAIGRNDQEIDLIFKYLEVYARDEMGVLPPTSRRTEAEEGNVSRATKYYRELLTTVETFLDTVKSKIFPSTTVADGSFNLGYAELTNYTSLLATNLNSFDGLGLIRDKYETTREQLTAIVKEMETRLAELSVAETTIREILDTALNTVDLETLACFDYEAKIAELLPWIK